MFNLNKAKKDPKFEKILRVLDRVESLPSLDSLIQSLSKKTKSEEIEKVAIGFDTNILLRITKHKNSTDIIDYLTTTHKAPVILPGQIIQEFWNNQLVVIDTISASLKKNFENLKIVTQKIDEDFGDYNNEFEALMVRFSNDYGSVYDQKTLNDLSSLLKSLAVKAQVPYAPRQLFYSCAKSRKKTKTPPGYKDGIDNYGDAFVWFDFLTGLLDAQQNKNIFSKAVFVTNEKKLDWCRSGGIAHPILVAEVKAIFDVEFEIWSLEELDNNISQMMNKDEK